MQNKGKSSEMATSSQWQGEGRGQLHLRRISSRATVPGVADVIHFLKTVTLIGRNREVVDCFLSCASPAHADYISRVHARIIQSSGAYELVDSSLTGIYVNDVRIHDKVTLKEGDTVAFGHPAGKSYVPGDRVRQPNSPLYFLFEHCHCVMETMLSPPSARAQQLPVSAAAGVPLPASLKLGHEQKAALPKTPWETAGPGWPPVLPSLPITSSGRTPVLPEGSSAGAPAPPAPEDAWESLRLPRRSTSPEYGGLEEGSRSPVEYCPPGTRVFLPQEGSGSSCSDSPGKQENALVGSAGSPWGFVCREEGSSPGASCPSSASAKELGSGGFESDGEMEVDRSSEEAPEYGGQSVSEPGRETQVAGEREAARCLRLAYAQRSSEGRVESEGLSWEPREKQDPPPNASPGDPGSAGSVASYLGPLPAAEPGNPQCDSAHEAPGSLPSAEDPDCGRVPKSAGEEPLCPLDGCAALLPGKWARAVQIVDRSAEESSQGTGSDGEGGLQRAPQVRGDLLAAGRDAWLRSEGAPEPDPTANSHDGFVDEAVAEASAKGTLAAEKEADADAAGEMHPRPSPSPSTTGCPAEDGCSEGALSEQAGEDPGESSGALQGEAASEGDGEERPEVAAVPPAESAVREWWGASGERPRTPVSGLPANSCEVLSPRNESRFARGKREEADATGEKWERTAGGRAGVGPGPEDHVRGATQEAGEEDGDHGGFLLGPEPPRSDSKRQREEWPGGGGELEEQAGRQAAQKDGVAVGEQQGSNEGALGRETGPGVAQERRDSAPAEDALARSHGTTEPSCELARRGSGEDAKPGSQLQATEAEEGLNPGERCPWGPPAGSEGERHISPGGGTGSSKESAASTRPVVKTEGGSEQRGVQSALPDGCVELQGASDCLGRRCESPTPVGQRPPPASCEAKLEGQEKVLKMRFQEIDNGDQLPCHAAWGLPGETQQEPRDFSGGNELCLRIAGFEAEKEDGSGTIFGGELRRTTVTATPGADMTSGSAPGSSAWCAEAPGESGIQGSREGTLQDSQAGPVKESEGLALGLGQEHPSGYESHCDDAAPPAHRWEVTEGEEPPPVPGSGVRGAHRGPQAVGRGPFSAEAACCPKSDAAFGSEEGVLDRVGLLEEETGSDHDQHNQQVGERLRTPRGPCGVGGAAEETPAHLCSEAGARTPEAAMGAIGLPGEKEELQPQGDARRHEDGPASLAEDWRFDSPHPKQCPEAPLQLQPELNSSSSRKRNFYQDEASVVGDAEDCVWGPKKVCLQDSGFDKATGGEINPIAWQEKGESIAQIVRDYFKSLPHTGEREAESSRVQPGTGPPDAARGKDSEPTGAIGAEEDVGCGEHSAAEVQDCPVPGQDPAREDRRLPDGARSTQMLSPAQAQDSGSESDIPESMWEPCFPEEGFALTKSDSPPGELVGLPSGKRSGASANCSGDSSPEPYGRNPPGGRASGDSAQVAKPADTRTDLAILCAPDWPVPQVPHRLLGSPGESGKADTLNVEHGARPCRRVDSADGGSPRMRNEASGTEDSGRAMPRLSPTHVKREQNDGPSEMPMGEGAFTQTSYGDLACQGAGQGAASDPLAPLERRGSPLARREAQHSPRLLKEEPIYDDHDFVGDRTGAPTCHRATLPVPALASEPVGCPTAHDGMGKCSPLHRSSELNPGLIRKHDRAEQTLLPSNSCSSESVTPGSAKVDVPGASLSLQREEGGPSPHPWSPSEVSGAPGSDSGPAEGPLGEAVGSGRCRDTFAAGGAGQAASTKALQAANLPPGTLLATDILANQAPPCGLSDSKDDAAALAGQLAGVSSSVLPVAKEEDDGGDSPGPLGNPSSASRPSVSPGMNQPCFPEAPENVRPGCSVQPQGRDRPEEEAAGSRLMCSDEECVRALAAEEGGASSSQEPCGAQTQSSRWPGAERTESGAPGCWASSEQDVEVRLQECQSILAEISWSLHRVEGIDAAHVEKWREQIAELQKAAAVPQTHIAVVGNTGAGKSCLLNALLEEECVLPTSAMRACTAVVVEISRAAGGSPYEADVEFLSHQEWYKELKALLEDMKDKSGNLRKRCPDRKSEAGAAYCRVKAVYGAVEELEKLQHVQDVTRHLGTVKRICADTAADFRTKIESYVDCRTDNLREMKGGEFWPIVKCVRIRLAKAEVLKTGAVLVDLPGIRDSNVARDSVAREYLKDCSAVWIVASITRAVDDKTAKEMLSENLRRQLLMDGRYGSLAFVCTKTDSFNVTDISRDLDLADAIQPLEDELRELEIQKIVAEAEKKTLYEHLQQEQRPRDERSDPGWLQERQHHLLEKELTISTLQRQKEATLRAISLVCVQARNKFAKQRILMDFYAGLQEMIRKAEDSECEEDGEEDMEEGDLAEPESGVPAAAESRLGKLRVFTVSSTEYLKLRGKLLRDGQAQVFHDIGDTEVPALRQFAMDTALKHSMVATEKIIRDLARTLSQMVNYLTSQRAEDQSQWSCLQEIVQQSLEDVPGLLQEAMEEGLRDIQYCFEVLLHAALRKGAAKAKELCEDIARSWGAPVHGYPHSTYRAVCNHNGVYPSPKYQCVDFNSHLARPIFEAISVTWDEIFSSRLVGSMESCTKALLEKLKSFFRDLKKKLSEQSKMAAAIQAICSQQMEAARARVFNFTLDLIAFSSERQRAISRHLTPEIRKRMERAYTACAQMSGPGYFQKMKETMELYVHWEKDTIFDSAVEKLWQQLDLLQQAIQGRFQNLTLELARSLKMQFEPVLKPVQRNAKVIPELLSTCVKVDKLCKRSCVAYVLPSPAQAESGCPPAPGRRPGVGDSLRFSTEFVDVRIGANPLPGVTAVQLSVDVAENLPDAPPAASIPQGLPEVAAVVQDPCQAPQVSLRPFGKKRAGEAVQPQGEKKHKGQAPVPWAGCGPAGSSPLSGSTAAKALPHVQDPERCLLPTVSCRLEGSRQKAPSPLGAPQQQLGGDPLVPPDGTGLLHTQGKEGMLGSYANRCEEDESVEAEKATVDARPA